MAVRDGHDIKAIAKYLGRPRKAVSLKAGALGVTGLEPSNADHEVMVYLRDDIFAKLQQSAKDLGTSTARTARIIVTAVLRDPWLFQFAIQPSMFVEDEPQRMNGHAREPNAIDAV